MTSGSRKCTSKVWDFFKLKEVGENGKKIKKATCKLCDDVSLAYSGGPPQGQTPFRDKEKGGRHT